MNQYYKNFYSMTRKIPVDYDHGRRDMLSLDIFAIKDGDDLRDILLGHVHPQNIRDGDPQRLDMGR